MYINQKYVLRVSVIKYNIYICKNNFIHISFDENDRFYMLGERIVITIVYIIYKFYFLNRKIGFYT